MIWDGDLRELTLPSRADVAVVGDGVGLGFVDSPFLCRANELCRSSSVMLLAIASSCSRT